LGRTRKKEDTEGKTISMHHGLHTKRAPTNTKDPQKGELQRGYSEAFFWSRRWRDEGMKEKEVLP